MGKRYEKTVSQRRYTMANNTNTGKYTQMPLVTGEKTTMSYHLHPH